MGGLVRWVTGLWPRSAAERFADGMHPDLAVGDDSFELYEAGCDLGDPVLPSRSDFVGCDCAGSLAADLMDHRPDCAARTGLRPAGERVPPTPPPAGHPDPLIAGNTPAAESEARSSVAGLPDLGYLIDRWRFRAARWDDHILGAAPADVAHQLRVAANELHKAIHNP